MYGEDIQSELYQLEREHNAIYTAGLVLHEVPVFRISADIRALLLTPIYYLPKILQSHRLQVCRTREYHENLQVTSWC